MIITLKTEEKSSKDFFSIPIMGSFVLLLIALLPIPIMFVINELLEIISNELLERINALFAGFWNVILTFYFKFRISIFFIPCWIFFIIIGVLRLFMIIE